MSGIKSNFNELNQINTEIKRISEVLRRLRARAKEVEQNILQYLESKEQEGVKYDGTVVLVESKTKRVSKKKKEVEEDSINVLREHGIENPERVLQEILEARRGEAVQNQKLKIKKLKNKE